VLLLNSRMLPSEIAFMRATCGRFFQFVNISAHLQIFNAALSSWQVLFSQSRYSSCNYKKHWVAFDLKIWWEFYKIKKKTFSAPFWHFSQSYWFYLYFCVKQPYRIKTNVTPSILSLQTLEMCFKQIGPFLAIFCGFPNFSRTSLKFWHKCHTCLESSGN